MQLTDHVYIVTGGAGAIAQPLNAAFVAAGARVAVVDRDPQRVPEAVSALGARAHFFAADLSAQASAQEMVRAVREHFGRVDGLVHTVGAFEMAPFADADAQAYDRMFDANVRTTWHALRAVLPELRAQRRGFICAFSSEPGWTGSAPGAALYGAAKSAVATLLRSLDAELKGSDIAVSILFPMGVVDTPANRRAMPGADPATFIDPVDIADTIVHAASRSPRGRVLELPLRPRR